MAIKPWNDPKVFNGSFVTKKPKKSKARTLKGERNAILSTSLGACCSPLSIDDMFDGDRLVEFSRPVIKHTTLTLPMGEATHQKATKPTWGQKAEGEIREKWSAKLRARTLPEVLKACMKVVQPKCGHHMYGGREARGLQGPWTGP